MIEVPPRTDKGTKDQLYIVVLRRKAIMLLYNSTT